MSQNRTEPFYTRHGANYNKESGLVEFKLFSKNGKSAILCIFDAPKGKEPLFNIKMTKKDNVFEAEFDPNQTGGLQNVFYYGYRVFGDNFEYDENWTPGSEIGFKCKVDGNNNRFNPNKLAYDPYSRELSHLHFDVCTDLDQFRSGTESYFTDNCKIAPKSVFRYIEPTEDDVPKPIIRALKDEIIGEVHLKSLTEIQKTAEHGTYKGAANFVSKIKELGVTMVEFLPLQEFDNNEGIGNYWGYMPLCYFAPVKRYALDQTDGFAVKEFYEMVKEFHKNGIKVCMDVVYNHTGEGKNYNGKPDDVNLFSYALIDNNDYYKSDRTGRYALRSGCGNDANTASDGFKHLVADSLEYFINLGVDAFRFDLAAALMDIETGADVKYDTNKSLVGELKGVLEKKGIKVNNPDEAAIGVNLIAEPWTCDGCNAYQLGNFPDYFAEWNDISRNTIRAFSTRPYSLDFLAVVHILRGSKHKFTSPHKSINYVACHDGFTLWDLNSYDKKAPNTCGGSDWELSSSYGGDKALRDRAIRNEIALLAMSLGCFMIQIDDIVLHSKGGNNNSYNIDGTVNYIDFEDLPGSKAELSEFIKNLINLRKKEEIFRNYEFAQNMRFFGLEGEQITMENSFWTRTECEFLGLSSFCGDRKVFIALNKGAHRLKFKFPSKTQIADGADGHRFFKVFDTQSNDFSTDGVLYEAETYEMAPNSIVLMFLK